MPVLVKDGKPISNVGGSGVGGNTGTNGGHHHPDASGHHGGDHDIVGGTGVNAGSGSGMTSLLDVQGLTSGHHPSTAGHHFSHHGVKPEYALSPEDVCGSAAEMHAAAAAVGLGSASAASAAAAAAPLPTLMHMGYGAPHHRHMLTSNHQDQTGMWHRSAW